ncbi:MAG: acyl-CoA dehydrogenase family protein [Desulfobacterales bacterium]
MDLGFTKDQELIRKSAREFFDKECPKDKVRELKEDEKGYDPKMWRKMVELGFLGLVIPEAYGGMNGDYLELVILMEEIGRNVVPSPFFSTVCACAPAIQAFGTDAQKDAFLSKIAEEGQVWALALTEATASYEAKDVAMRAVSEGNDYILNGTKLFVSYANVADQLLVVARTGKGENPEEGVTAFVVDAKSPGIRMAVMPTAARDMRCEVVFENVKVSSKNILGDTDRGWDIVEYILQYATVLKSAEMSGGAEAVLDLATTYARERHQFDQPIGSFQAVQHRLVDVLTEVEGLKNLVYEAAWHIDVELPSKMLVSMVKAKANGVYQKTCLDGMLVHGAIGFTEEMDVGLFRLRAKAYEFDCGGTDFHLERIAQELENDESDFLMMEK